MEPRSLTFVVEKCGGELVSGSPSAMITRVCTDSRQVQGGDLFVALAGERFDGHDYVAGAAEKGAVAVLVERAKVQAAPAGCAAITVGNTRRALGKLGAGYRRDFDLPLIAVGGSNGKTTTKELLAAVLGQRFKTLRSEASFNNDVGVPLTLLNLDNSHQAAVLEVGTNHPGELAPLVQMIQPRYGVLTSLGREHLEFLGGLDGVAEEEGWLAELMPRDGRLFVNGESPGIENVIGRTCARVTRVGFGGGNDCRALDLRLDESGVSFHADVPQRSVAGAYRVNLLGRHQVTNVLLALVVGAEFGLTRAEIQRGLAGFQPPRMRMQYSKIDGVSLLDDAYNANTDSVLAALRTLQEFPCAGRRVAVLGDMAELGKHSPDAHAEVGRCAAELKVDQLFAVGKMAGVMGAAARAAGLMRVHELGEVETAANAIKHFVKHGDVVLIKASRATRLERVAEVLRGKTDLL